MNPMPTKDQIRQWITENPGLVAKRDIANAFGIKGDARIDLKRLLKELEAEGGLEVRSRKFRAPGALPPVSVLLVLPPDANGDLFARPLEDDADDAPRILIVPQKGDPALAAGERVLARLAAVAGEDHGYEARLIRRIGTNPLKLLGVFRENAEGGRIIPIDKGNDKEWRVARDHTDKRAHSPQLWVVNITCVSRRQHSPSMRVIVHRTLVGFPEDRARRAAVGAPLESVIPAPGTGSPHIALAHAAAEAHAHWKL